MLIFSCTKQKSTKTELNYKQYEQANSSSIFKIKF